MRSGKREDMRGVRYDKTEYSPGRYGREPYVFGSAAPAFYDGSTAGELLQDDAYDYDDGYEREMRQRRRTARRAGRERAAHSSPAAILGMLAVVAIMSIGLVKYIGLQFEVTHAVGEIASLESQLTALKAANDETLSEINSSVNLDEVKYRAMTQLGMKYADQDQIVTYDNGMGDYVTQVKEVGK